MRIFKADIESDDRLPQIARPGLPPLSRRSKKAPVSPPAVAKTEKFKAVYKERKLLLRVISGKGETEQT